MFYATFNEDNVLEIAEFLSEAERDDWVNYRDPISLLLHTTIDNTPFERIPFDNERIICMLHDVSVFNKRSDEFNDRITWYSYNI